MKSISLKLVGSLCGTLALTGFLSAEDAWWNTAWTQRQMVTLDSGTDAAALSGEVSGSSILVRLHDGNFQFTSANEDGSDLRFVASDGKTRLSHHLESYDSLLNEAFVWVKLNDIKSSAKQSFYIYFGNPAPDAAGDPVDAYDADTTLVYHFSGRGTAPTDATRNGNHAETPAAAADGSIIGGGLRLLANVPVIIPSSPTLEWKAGQALTLSTWIKFGAPQEAAVIVSRGEGSDSFKLLLDQGIPSVEVAGRRSQAAEPIAAGSWNHLVLVADGSSMQLFLNGALYSKLDAALPVLSTPILLGGPGGGFVGEMDEFAISNTARSIGWIELASVNQGASDAAARTLFLGEVEGGVVESQSEMLQHVMLFGDIAANMMFDGWIAVGVCVLMIAVGWTVAVKKFIYLNSIEKGTNEFLKKWKTLSTDLTSMDPDDQANVSSLGGKFDPAQQALIEKSPLYHIYHIGAEEIRHRLDKDNNRIQGLSGRSIQAIRASLDAGLVHESHRLSNGLVYLTISIAGGPYVGLLGTVVGVMITFAIIAKSGEVNVNSIAPGIASALLATVAGLIVAIPALFIYSYLNGRIKNSLGLMQVFIDEFVAKMAEFYRPAQEKEAPETELKS
jgi:biopolymer transport protein ExbB